MLLFDIIIPTYNRAQFLPRAINSVLNQSIKSFQLIIVDDGSTDETAEILRSYQDHPQITIVTQKNAGVSSARNTGVKYAKAHWIAFLDSDDEWLTDKLKLTQIFIENNPNLQFIHTEELWIRHNVRVNLPKKFDKSSENIFERSLDFCLISPSTVVMSKELFYQYGPFNEEFPVCEDYDLWNKILSHEAIGYIDIPLTKKYGGHEDQLSTKYFGMDYWRFKSLTELYKDNALTLEKKELIKQRILLKGSILLKGFHKYQNQEKINEINLDLLNLSK